MEASVWAYVQGGAGAERTLAENEAAFARWCLVPENCSGVRSVDLATTVLGQGVSAPFFVAPTAYHREVHPEGERGTATAASALGVLGVYSTLSSDSLEVIAAARTRGPQWFQLYLQPEVGRSLDLVHRAEKAGYSAIVVTVDTPVLGYRDNQERTGFATTAPVPIGNGAGVQSPARGPAWQGEPCSLGEGAEVSWKALEEVRDATPLPLVVKGVLTPETARRAVDLGARAVVVSNHGGRQLDLAPASLDALPGVVEAVGRDVEVYVDGGVRRGSDVAVALALGARAVGLGRPVLWALAVAGAAGVDRYLRMLGTELVNTMLLMGCSTVGGIDRSRVHPAREGAAEVPPTGPMRARERGRTPRHRE